MNENEKKARAALVTHYGQLINPKYAPNPAKAEELLKEAVRRCWSFRADFPEWVKGYVKRWAEQASADSAAGDQGWIDRGVRSHLQGSVAP